MFSYLASNLGMSNAETTCKSSEADPLTALCEELDAPLQEVINLLYLATESVVSTRDLHQYYLRTAQARLQSFQQRVRTHCRPKLGPFDLAS